MYLPPAPFSLPDAITCAGLVDVAYDQYAQWSNQGYPSKSDFVWTPPSAPAGYTYSAPLIWTNEWLFIWYDEPFGFIAQNTNGDTFLVLRGTQSDADEAQDARLDQVSYGLVEGFGNVHAGFYTIYQLLSPQIYTALQKFSNIGRFFFAGHSLGRTLM
jgi:hypothetical protein